MRLREHWGVGRFARSEDESTEKTDGCVKLGSRDVNFARFLPLNACTRARSEGIRFVAKERLASPNHPGGNRGSGARAWIEDRKRGEESTGGGN